MFYGFNVTKILDRRIGKELEGKGRISRVGSNNFLKKERTLLLHFLVEVVNIYCSIRGYILLVVGCHCQSLSSGSTELLWLRVIRFFRYEQWYTLV
jgi:hypothetical protein